MKTLYTLFLLIGFQSYTVRAQALNPKIHDQFIMANFSKVQGHIGEKLDQSYKNRILAQDIDHLIEPFRHCNETHLWQSEFWGKWFTSAVLAYRYRPEQELMNVLKKAVSGIIATQTPDGYIGNYSKEHRLEQWDIWGRKYTMLGLLDFYELTKDKASLIAAVKVADHLMKEIDEKDGLIVNKGNYRGMAASSVLEPIIKLYVFTKNEKYLDFAKEIVSEWETQEGPNLISKANVDVSKRFPKPESWYSYAQGQKAYEMMSCYEGLLELYRITGKELYKEAVEETWKSIKNTEINITGSGASEEMWFGGTKLQTIPISHYQETCVTVTWIKLNQQLLRLTGDPKYADEIERSYYNALLGSLNFNSSDWAKYTPLNGQRLAGSGQCGMDLNCCVASGPRAQFTLPLTTIMSTNEGLAVNFYVNGYYQLKTPAGKKIALVQNTDFPISGHINLTLDLLENEEMTLQFRIPGWSKINKVTVNNKEILAVKPGEYVKIKRNWSAKDIINIELDMRGRVDIYGEVRKFAAISRGPMVLARDSRFEGPPLITINRPLSDKDGYIQLKPILVGENNNLWMQYTALFVPESYAELEVKPIEIDLVDYATAGNGKVKSTFQVWFSQIFSKRDN
ncbi:DUF1680 family protein [Pedobacter sp. CG_S7]|uniref:glycoside hydrolase family 127 protein n=1 Tax=Pedobacter sp. CG_S7 TaxID=3143930 RepID=UPI00339ADE26